MHIQHRLLLLYGPDWEFLIGCFHSATEAGGIYSFGHDFTQNKTARMLPDNVETDGLTVNGTDDTSTNKCKSMPAALTYNYDRNNRQEPKRSHYLWKWKQEEVTTRVCSRSGVGLVPVFSVSAVSACAWTGMSTRTCVCTLMPAEDMLTWKQYAKLKTNSRTDRMKDTYLTQFWGAGRSVGFIVLTGSRAD